MNKIYLYNKWKIQLGFSNILYFLVFYMYKGYLKFWDILNSIIPLKINVVGTPYKIFFYYLFVIFRPDQLLGVITGR